MSGGVSEQAATEAAGPVPSRSEAFNVFGKIGLLSFGGPAAQISLMHRELVEERPWLSEQQFLRALSFCMLLPGPEAMQLATYCGWRLHGTLGGLIAGLLFVLPGAFVVLVLAAVYAYFGDVPLVSALFLGVKAAVLIVVVEALLRVSKKALKGTAHWVIAALAFVAIFFLALPYPLIVLASGLYGFFFLAESVSDNAPAGQSAGGMFKQTAITVAVWLAIWFVPIIVLDQVFGLKILGQIAAFFSKLAVVTFGGAYAVLAYMTQDVVAEFGWLTTGEMMDGLGLAETTPGPLILVTEFVGFLAAFREGGFWLGVVGALVTLWVTFVPCFLWIFAGAPYIDWLGGQPRLSAALAAITAAVVGVILNLSVWFGLHVLFREVATVSAGPLTLLSPDITSLDWRVVVLTSLAGWLLLVKHWGIVKVLAICAASGWVLSQI